MRVYRQKIEGHVARHQLHVHGGHSYRWKKKKTKGWWVPPRVGDKRRTSRTNNKKKKEKKKRSKREYGEELQALRDVQKLKKEDELHR